MSWLTRAIRPATHARSLATKAAGHVITTEHEHGVSVITLNNPSKLNALTGSPVSRDDG